MLDRRGFLTGMVGVVAAPLVAEAQAEKLYRIGFLGVACATDFPSSLEAFRQGLRYLGYEEGRNIRIDYRWAQRRVERLPGLAVELVRLHPDVLVTHARGVAAAQQATTTIPIVIGAHSDPVRLNYVKSFARP